MLNYGTKQFNDLRSTRQLNHSFNRYAWHDRYRIPLDHPLALRFYLNHLFVAHSRREMLGGAIIRALPFMGRASLLADRLQGDGISGGKLPPSAEASEPDLFPPLQTISLEQLNSLLEKHLREAGLARSGSVVSIALEDYPNLTRYQTVLFLFDRASSSPCAIAKITRQGGAHALLEHEFKALMALQGELSQELRTRIPRPLAFLKPAELTVLLETFVPGRSIYFDLRNSWYPRFLAREHFRWAREWLVQFQKATGMGELHFDEEVLKEHVIDPLTHFQSHCDPSRHERRMIDHAIKSAQALCGLRIPLVSRHGDFWPRNLIMEGSTFGVVDWERFLHRSMPFSDLFMFATSYGLSYPWKLGSWAQPAAAFRGTYLEKTWLSQLVREYLQAYCQEMGVSDEMLEVFFPVFLAEQSIQEKNLPGTGNRVQIWRRFIQEYAQQGGSVCFGS